MAGSVVIRYNYTRTFPEADYNVYAALSYDGTEPHQLSGKLEMVISDPTQPNQTLTELGAFDGPGTRNVGGWGANEIIQLTDSVGGSPVTVHLAGTQTIRYTANSGDFDYLAFVPTAARPRITSISVNADGQLTITWTAGSGQLQTATSVTGPWTDTGNTTGTFTAPVSGAPDLFFRLKQ